MRVDKDDRYMPEQSNKQSTLSFNISTFFQQYSKKKLIVMGLALIIIVLLLSLMIFRSLKPKTPTPLTPPEINSVSSTEVADTINNEQANEGINSTQIAQTPSAAPNNRGRAPIDDVNGRAQTNGITSMSGHSQNHLPTKSAKPNSPTTDISTTHSSGSSNNDATTNKPQDLNSSDHKPVRLSSDNDVKTGKNSTSIANIKDTQFAIQLSSSSSIDGLKELVKKHNLTNYQIYETKRNNDKWYILVNGTYDSADEARKAIKSLPSEMQNNKPWIKSGATINKEKSAK